MNQKLKPIFLALLLGCFVYTFTACTVEENKTVESSSSEEELKSDAENSVKNDLDKKGIHSSLENSDGKLSFQPGGRKPNEKYEVSYVDYFDVFLKEGEEKNITGRYSDITADGKIDWTKDELQSFREDIIRDDMMSKLTINGEKVTLPCKFKDLGEEYADFDKVNFSKINKSMFPFVISEKDYGNGLNSGIYSDGFYYELMYLIDENNDFVMGLCVDFKTNEIVGLCSCDYIFPQLDIRLDGIGIGNTLNEAYEKLGLPSRVEDRSCRYYCENEEYIYIIEFESGIFVREDIKNNMITNVSITIVEVKNRK